MKYLLLIVVAIFFACEDDVYHSEENHKVYFQFEYVNYAWTPQHEGFIVDKHGNIFEYDNPGDWNHVESNRISVDKFQDNMDKSETSLKTVDGTELNKMLGLAFTARKGKLTDLKSVMNDAGAESYYIYIAKEGDEQLTRYLLQMRGDNYQKNDSSAAEEITDWLIGIRGEEGFSDEHF